MGRKFDEICETMTQKWVQTLEMFLFILVPVKTEFHCSIRKCLLNHLKEWGMSHLQAEFRLCIPFSHTLYQSDHQYSVITMINTSRENQFLLRFALLYLDLWCLKKSSLSNDKLVRHE